MHSTSTDVVGPRPESPPQLHLDRARYEVVLSGRRVRISPTQFDILDALVGAHGRILSKSDLMDRVWGHRHFGSDNHVAVHVHRLRAALGEDDVEPSYIETIRGRGYRYIGPPTSSAAVPAYTLIHDEDLKLLDVLPRAPFLGWEPERVIGRHFDIAGLQPETSRDIANAFRAAGSGFLGRWPARTADGGFRMADVRTRLEAPGMPGGFSTEIRLLF